MTSLIAFPCAYALAFKVSDTAARWAIFFLIIPFFTSYLVRVYAWQVIIAEHGVINAALALVGLDPFIMLNTRIGTLIGYLTLCLPLVVISADLLARCGRPHPDRSGHNLGCGRMRTVLTIIVPLAKVGLIIGAVFCFILSFGDFVSPYYLGGSRPPTLSILIIDTTKSGQQWPKAAVVAVTMIATCWWWPSPRSARPTGSGLDGRPRHHAVFRLYVFVVFCFVFAPIAASFVFSFNSDRFPTIPLGSFTLHWYETVYNDPDVWTP